MIIQHNESEDGKSKIHNVVDKIEVDLENRIIKQVSHGISRTIFLIVKYSSLGKSVDGSFAKVA